MAKNAVVSEELASKFKSEKETPYTRWVKAEGLDIIPGRAAAATPCSSITTPRAPRTIAM